MTTLEVSLTPADFGLLPQRDLGETVCVVFDILRATSSMVTAFGHGAKAIVPVSEISEALEIKEKQPDVLLAGERHGLRIKANQTGGVDFDFGNSPREFVAEKIKGKTIVWTTTNGTRALRACAGAKTILLGSFLNLRAITTWIEQNKPSHLLLVCSGTFEEAAFEDTLAAGALADSIWNNYKYGHLADSAQIARTTYICLKDNLEDAPNFSLNAQRLLSKPDLRDDVELCFHRNRFHFVVGMKDGMLQVV